VVDERRISKPERAIAGARAAFIEALRHGDIEAVARLYGTSARLVAPSTEVIEGRDAIGAFWHAGREAGIVDVELRPSTVGPERRLAYEIGRYVLRVRPAADELVVDRGNYVLVLGRDSAGSWRRVVEMFSPAGAPLAIGSRSR
jgi:ketosteroid isomerase-like protein